MNTLIEKLQIEMRILSMQTAGLRRQEHRMDTKFMPFVDKGVRYVPRNKKKW